MLIVTRTNNVSKWLKSFCFFWLHPAWAKVNHLSSLLIHHLLFSYSSCEAYSTLIKTTWWHEVIFKHGLHVCAEMIILLNYFCPLTEQPMSVYHTHNYIGSHCVSDEGSSGKSSSWELQLRKTSPSYRLMQMEHVRQKEKNIRMIGRNILTQRCISTHKNAVLDALIFKMQTKSRIAWATNTSVLLQLLSVIASVTNEAVIIFAAATGNAQPQTHDNRPGPIVHVCTTGMWRDNQERKT